MEKEVMQGNILAITNKSSFWRQVYGKAYMTKPELDNWQALKEQYKNDTSNKWKEYTGQAISKTISNIRCPRCDEYFFQVILDSNTELLVCEECEIAL